LRDDALDDLGRGGDVVDEVDAFAGPEDALRKIVRRRREVRLIYP
jgi:hypothetical protein